jgi:hypothetical protein
MVAPVKNMEEVFVLQPVTEQKPLLVFKIPFHFPGIRFPKMTGQNRKKQTF